MHELYELKENLMDELKKVIDKGTISRDSLEVIDKLTHSLKSVTTIIAMEEAEDDGYSSEGDYSNDDYSNARGRGRNARRDSRGRYSSRRSGRYYYEGGMSGRRGYSRDDYSGDDKMSMLEEMMENASDPREREMIQKMMDQYR